MRTTRLAPGLRPVPGRVLILLALGFLSFVLLVMSRLDHSLARSLRHGLDEALVPVMTALEGATSPLRGAVRRLDAAIDSGAEVERLRAENQRLREAQGRLAEMERRLSDLTPIARIVPESAQPSVTARIIASSGATFARSLLLNAGRDHQIRVGYPVLAGQSLAGRVVEVGPSFARVLLPIDAASRIPVAVGPGASRAVMAGDGSAEPRLVLGVQGGTFKDGDTVISSGVGGMFPRGLPIGVVTMSSGLARVRLIGDASRVDHLIVLLHDTPASDLIESATRQGERQQAGARALEAIPAGEPQRTRR